MKFRSLALLALSLLLSGAALSQSNNGTVVGSPTFGAAKFGNGLTATSDSNYISLPTNSFPGGTTYTIEAQVKTTSSNTGTEVVLGVGGSGYRLDFSMANGQFKAGVPNIGNIQGTSSIHDGVWHHCALVVTPTQAAIYVDGTLQTTVTGSTAAVGSTNGILGRWIDTGLPWTGSIDEVAVWNVAKYTGSSFTPPTSAYTGTEANLVSLYHLQSDGTDSTYHPTLPTNKVQCSQYSMSGSQPSVSPSLASAPTVGNVLVAFISRDQGTAITPPSGWTQQTNVAGSGTRLFSYTHTVASGDGQTYTWTFPDYSESGGIICEFSGLNTTSPINSYGTSTGSTDISTIASGSATPTVIGTYPFAGFATVRTASSYTISNNFGIATYTTSPYHGAIAAVGPATTDTTTAILATLTLSGTTTAGSANGMMLLLTPSAATVAATPTTSPGAGSYTRSQTTAVTFAAPSSGTTVHITNDGTAATCASPAYSGPYTVTLTTTFNAVACGSGYVTSALLTATYTITDPVIVPEPVASPAAGWYTTGQTVTLSVPSAPSGTTIYYTTNGTEPNTSSSVYSGPITMAATGTINARGYASGDQTSSMFQGVYRIQALAPTLANVTVGTNQSLNGYVPFPADYWHQRADTITSLDTNSSAIISGLGNGTIHHDFGNGCSSNAVGNPVCSNSGFPYQVVSGVPPIAVPLTLSYGVEGDQTYYPVPSNLAIEGAPGNCVTISGNDAHALFLDLTSQTLNEFYNAYTCNGAATAGLQNLFDLTSSTSFQRPYGLTSVDAAGLSVFEGIPRYDEILQGAITHALRFTVQQSNHFFAFPATHEAAGYSGVNVFGMKQRLKASFDCTSVGSATNQIICIAMKRYGMIAADNGGNDYFQGSYDTRWVPSDLDALNNIPRSSFEVVPISTQYNETTAPTGTVPTINSFTATPSSVNVGQCSTLASSVSNATESFIDKAGFTRGSTQVCPLVTTTYTLKTNGLFNSQTYQNSTGLDRPNATVTVTVLPGILTNGIIWKPGP